MAVAFREYLAAVGLPEVVLAERMVRSHILPEYIDLISYNDLMER